MGPGVAMGLQVTLTCLQNTAITMRMWKLLVQHNVAVSSTSCENVWANLVAPVTTVGPTSPPHSVHLAPHPPSQP